MNTQRTFVRQQTIFGVLIAVSIHNPLFFAFTIENVIDMPLALNEGKQRYDALSAKIPQYGECWNRAVSQLTVGCRFLTEDVQSSLALRFTDCFLQKSGNPPIDCDVPQRECLSKLSDRSFNAYTEFYTHTQSICYYLQSKLWHEQTERTIDNLSTTSLKVSHQLAETEKGQEALLQQQRESIQLQENLGEHLKASKDDILKLMEDLQTSTLEQKASLLALFEQLASLQAWVVTEVSWFESIFFYVSCCLLTLLFTSTPRTLRARFPLFAILTLNYVAERQFYSYMNSGHESIFIFTDSLTFWIWWWRKGTLAACLFVICSAAVTYCDYDIVNNAILVKMLAQSEEILQKLNCSAMRNNPLFNRNFKTSFDTSLRFESDFLDGKGSPAFQNKKSSETPEDKRYGIESVADKNHTPIARRKHLSVDVFKHNLRSPTTSKDAESDTSVKTLRRSNRIQNR